MPHREQRARTTELLDRRGIGSALFAAPATVTWLTGFAPPVQVGPSPFRGQPAYVWYRQERFFLLVQDAHEADVAALAEDPGVAIVPYTTYILEQPIAIGDHLASALAHALAAAPPEGDVGIELDHVPGRLADLVRKAAGATRPIDGWLDPLRMVKTDEELAVLRRAFALADAGHVAARDATRPGAREIDVWAAIRGAVERHAGRRVALGNDCVSGRRDANVGGWPEDRELGEGDPLLVDLGARVDGYWSDSCATYVAGAPGRRLREVHAAVSDALEHAMGLVRPGICANEIDRAVRAFVGGAGWPVYPHHTGHGVGTSSHEAPRLTPHDDTPLEPGMVILLEPGIYLPGEIGVRLEHALLVTPDGAERLTGHDTDLGGTH